VAKSYEFIESLKRYVLDGQNYTPSPEVEKLPKDYPLE
jgi:hypothetical protein